MTERPNWQEEAQANVHHWGTTHPLTLVSIRTTVIYDRDGRPLIEGNPNLPNPADVPNKLVTSNFPDVRHGRLANASAYAATATHLDDALGILSHIRGIVYPFNEPLDIQKLAEIINTSFLIGTYMVLKSDSPARNGEIPTQLGALAKLSGGLAKVTTTALSLDRITNYFGIPPMSYPLDTPEEFLEAVFGEDLQTGENTVCPAPKPVMLRAIQALYNPIPVSTETKAILGLDDAEIKRVAMLGIANSIAHTEKVSIEAIQKIIMDQVMVKKAKQRLLTGNPHANILTNAANPRIVSAVENSLVRLNEAQRLLNEALLRDPAPPLTLEDMR